MSEQFPTAYGSPIADGPLRTRSTRVSPWTAWTLWMLVVLGTCAAATWVTWQAWDSWGDQPADPTEQRLTRADREGVLSPGSTQAAKVNEQTVMRAACATYSEQLDRSYGTLDAFPTWSYAQVATDLFSTFYTCVDDNGESAEVRVFSDGRVVYRDSEYSRDQARKLGVEGYLTVRAGSTPAERGDRNLIAYFGVGVPAAFALLSFLWLVRRPSLGRRALLWVVGVVAIGMIGGYAGSRGDVGDVPTTIAAVIADVGILLVLIFNRSARRAAEPRPAPGTTTPTISPSATPMTRVDTNPPTDYRGPFR